MAGMLLTGPSPLYNLSQFEDITQTRLSHISGPGTVYIGKPHKDKSDGPLGSRLLRLS
jgi:hypothetical protein